MTVRQRVEELTECRTDLEACRWRLRRLGMDWVLAHGWDGVYQQVCRELELWEEVQRGQV